MGFTNYLTAFNQNLIEILNKSNIHLLTQTVAQTIFYVNSIWSFNALISVLDKTKQGYISLNMYTFSHNKYMIRVFDATLILQ